MHVQGKTDEAKSDLARLAKIRAEREAGAWAIRGGDGIEEATVHAMFSLGGVLAEDPRQTRVWVLKLGMYRLQRGRTGGGKRVREEVSTQARAMESTKGPSQRKHVAPPGVGREEREHAIDIAGFKVLAERVEPERGDLLSVDIGRN